MHDCGSRSDCGFGAQELKTFDPSSKSSAGCGSRKDGSEPWKAGCEQRGLHIVSGRLDLGSGRLDMGSGRLGKAKSELRKTRSGLRRAREESAEL